MNWKKYYEGKRAAEKIVKPSTVSGSGYIRMVSTPQTHDRFWYREYNSTATITTGH